MDKTTLHLEAPATHFEYSWIIAVVLAIVASTISNVGLNLQKLALNMRKEEAKRLKSLGSTTTSSSEQSSSSTSTPLRGRALLFWLFGMAGIVGGALCDFGALAFGAQSVVAPLGSWTLVSNLLVAPAMLGEKIKRKDFVATLVIVCGCAIAVSTATHEDPLYTLEQLFSLYRRTEFAIYACIVTIVVIGMLFAIRKVERIRAIHGKRSPQYFRVAAFHRISYAAVSGILGAQSVLFAKTLVEAITTTASGGALFLADWRTYLVIVALAGAIVGQVHTMQWGLARFDALICVPIFSCFWILVSVAGGGVFFDEFSGLTPLQSGLFPFGVLLCCLGVYSLSLRAESNGGGGGINAAATTTTLHGDGQLQQQQHRKKDILSDSDIEASEESNGSSSGEEEKDEEDDEIEEEEGESGEKKQKTKKQTLDKIDKEGDNTISLTIVSEDANSRKTKKKKTDTEKRSAIINPNSNSSQKPKREKSNVLPTTTVGPEDITLEFTRNTVGLSFRRTIVKLLDASNLESHRLADVWVVVSNSSNNSNSNNNNGNSAGTKAVGTIGTPPQPGDVLIAVNGESVLDRWVSATDAIRRITLASRPLSLTFRVAPETPARRVWVRHQLLRHGGQGVGSAAEVALVHAALNTHNHTHNNSSTSSISHHSNHNNPSGSLRSTSSSSTTPVSNMLHTRRNSSSFTLRVGSSTNLSGLGSAAGIIAGGGGSGGGRARRNSYNNNGSGSGASNAADCLFLESDSAADADSLYKATQEISLYLLVEPLSFLQPPPAQQTGQSQHQESGATASSSMRTTEKKAEETAAITSEAAWGDYEVEVLVQDASDAISATKSMQMGQSAMRGMSLDPFNHILHMGGFKPSSMMMHDSNDDKEEEKKEKDANRTRNSGGTETELKGIIRHHHHTAASSSSSSSSVGSPRNSTPLLLIAPHDRSNSNNSLTSASSTPIANTGRDQNMLSRVGEKSSLLRH